MHMEPSWLPVFPANRYSAQARLTVPLLVVMPGRFIFYRQDIILYFLVRSDCASYCALRVPYLRKNLSNIALFRRLCSLRGALLLLIYSLKRPPGTSTREDTVWSPSRLTLLTCLSAIAWLCPASEPHTTNVKRQHSLAPHY
jgi:hypothetical protein